MKRAEEQFSYIDEGTIIDAVNKWIETRPKKTALLEKRGGRWADIGWAELGERVLDIASGLQTLGIAEGDRVALFSENRIEWTYADLAILSLGAVSVPIYATSSAEQLHYILDHCGAKAIFINTPPMAEKVESVRGKLPDLTRVIIFSPEAGKNGWDLSLEELCSVGRAERERTPLSFRELCNRLSPEDLATIMYTSGTTGPPKGCILTHKNIMYICQSISCILPLKKNDLVLSFLPLAHAMERNGGQFISLYFGIPTAYATSLDTVAEDLRAVRPTFSRAVPRFFEKAYNRLQVTLAGYSPRKRAIFNWALETGIKYQALKQEGRSVPPGLRLKRVLANLLVYRKIKKVMGGRIRFFVSGGAPLAREIIEFFSALGVLVAEGYGLTETTVIASINRFTDYRFGTVGRPIPGAAIKIAPDGEILIRHEGVFKGYYLNDAATREVIDEDGWFHSGDIGFFDEAGFLVISDRKKDLIITAGGKNITPQNLENSLKTHPLISQAMVYGDRRPYLVALVTVDEDSLAEQAPRFGINLQPGMPHSRNMELRRVLEEFINENNRAFSRAEMIRKFTVLDEDFSQELDEITPTQKVKRRQITGRYMDLIEKLYEEGDTEIHSLS